MTTMLERDTYGETAERASPVRRRWPALAIAALVALLALGGGVLIGRATAPADKPVAVAAGGAELTDRQTQMSDALDAKMLAWRAGDGAAVTALFAPSGVLQLGTAQYRVDDGSLAAYVEGHDWSSLTVERPVLIDGDRLVFVYRILGQHYLGTLDFTPTGEVLIVRQALVS